MQIGARDVSYNKTISRNNQINEHNDRYANRNKEQMTDSGLLELFTRGYPELHWGREQTGQLEIWGKND